MPDIDLLYREILAKPDDDTVRLAYADLLDERGWPHDVDRAEFIRVQVELWRLDPDRQTGCGLTNSLDKLYGHPLVKREFDLLEKWVEVPGPGGKSGKFQNRFLWAWEIGFRREEFDFVRGFPGRAMVTWQEWTRYSERYLKHPVQEVELRTMPDVGWSGLIKGFPLWIRRVWFVQLGLDAKPTEMTHLAFPREARHRIVFTLLKHNFPALQWKLDVAPDLIGVV
jgi:uncharacterized protein (TIGR02996 family)